MLGEPPCIHIKRVIKKIEFAKFLNRNKSIDSSVN